MTYYRVFISTTICCWTRRDYKISTAIIFCPDPCYNSSTKPSSLRSFQSISKNSKHGKRSNSKISNFSNNYTYCNNAPSSTKRKSRNSVGCLRMFYRTWTLAESCTWKMVKLIGGWAWVSISIRNKWKRARMMAMPFICLTSWCIASWETPILVHLRDPPNSTNKDNYV